MGPKGDVWAWLRHYPSADELRAAFPKDWAVVEKALSDLLDRNDVNELHSFAASVSRPKGRANGNAALTSEIRRQIALRLLRRLNLSLATGVASGTVRFNRRNGWVVQRLFFRRGLERKPTSMFWYRILWKRLRQRRYLMPLVSPKGIYCFYSKALVERLAALIGDRQTVEIAAGDGTLSRFLGQAGVNIVATDDHSWASRVDHSGVIRQDAVAALRMRQPSVVVCSWPPADNDFEQEVFRTRSVELYVVVGSRHEHAAGSWKAYRRQRAFEMVEDLELGRLVLPDDLDSAVYVFRRRRTAGDSIDLTAPIDAVNAPPTSVRGR